jgi:hypothetical protein
MQGGLQIANGVSIFGTGVTVQWLGLPLAIGLVGAVGGVVLAVCAIPLWRSALPGGTLSDAALADAARHAAAIAEVPAPAAVAHAPTTGVISASAAHRHRRRSRSRHQPFTRAWRQNRAASTSAESTAAPIGTP